MGTTLTAALVDADGVSLAHVGDSRAYRMRDGGLERLTIDHSLVGELVRRGKLTEAEAEEHPQKSVITRALGVEAGVQVDTITYPARAGDVFLLCSDGLTSMVGDDLVGEILRSSETLSEAGHALVDEANAHGGRDNITVVLFRLEDFRRGSAVRRRRPPDQATMLGAAAPSTADVNAALRARERDAAAGGRDPAAPQAPARREPRRPRRRGGDPELTRAGGSAGCGRCSASWRSSRSIGIAGWMVSRAVFFVGTDDAGLRHRLSRPALRGPVRHQALRELLRLRRAGRRPARGPPLASCSTISCAAAPTPPTSSARSSSTNSTRSEARAMKARNRELLGLIPASLLIVAGFTAVFVQRQDDLSNVSLTYGAIFLGLCLAGAHLPADRAAPRRPVPLPALRRAGQRRAGDDLPDRRDARAPAGPVVRRSAWAASRPRSSSCATTASSSATAT